MTDFGFEQQEADEAPSPVRQITLSQRPGQALQNILAGDLPGAWDSMLKPEDLTPRERDAFLKQHGLDKGPFAPVYRLLTNPTLIVALALNYAFPVATANNIFKLSEKVGSLTSRIPILGQFLSSRALFRGTEVPEVIAKIASDRNAFHTMFQPKMAAAFEEFEKTLGRAVTNREQIMVSCWLDGLHKQVRGFGGHNGIVKIGREELAGVGALMPDLEEKMGAPLLTVAKKIRGNLDEMWSTIFGDPENRAAISRAVQRQKGGELAPDLVDALEDWVKDPKKIPDYFPHRILQTDVDFRKMMEALTASTKERVFAKKALFRSTSWVGPEALKREYGMLPAMDDIQKVRDLVDPGEYNKLLEITKARILHGVKELAPDFRELSLTKLRQLPLSELLTDYGQYLQPSEAKQVAGVIGEFLPRQYSLKLAPVLQSYTHSMTGTYAWTTQGGGEEVGRVIDDLREASLTNPYAKRRLEMMENTLVPMTMGRGTFKQALKSQSWDFEMTRMSAFMEKPSVRVVLGDKLTDYLQKTMQQSRGAFSLLNLNRKAASYFYMSTLGLNPASAMKNLLQTVMTTGPVIGYKTAAEGAAVAFQKSHKYFALRMGGKNLGHEAALALAYPEYAATGLAAAPLMDEALQNALRNAHEIAALPTGKLAKGADKIGRAMLAMFTASENANRLLTFEGGMIHAGRAGLKGQEALDFSRKLVEMTQFSAGPQNTPFFLLNKTPLFRQFLQFPLKMVEFATSTAWTLGSGQPGRTALATPFNVLGLNPGTFARMVAGSTIAMELGETLGIDTKDALIEGTMPGMRTEGPFAPLPMLPPFVQIVGAAGMSLAKGDFQDLVKQTPLLFPAGIPLARAVGMLPVGMPGAQFGQDAAKALERQYADYNQPAPDGRIAVYTGKGQLRGYYTPWQIVAAGMGIKVGDMQTEQQLLKTLVANRDQIREYRRSWLEARFGNDTGKTARIEAEYKQRYGSPLPVTQEDVTNMQKRRQMTRLEQVVETMPPGPEREQFAQMVAASLGGEATNLLGIEPSTLGQPASKRQAKRTGILQQTPYSNQMGPMGPGVNPQTVGRQPYPKTNYMGY